jgi:small subunit ribosomal protein S1
VKIVENVDVLDGWLTEAYDYARPRRGQICQGEILKIEENGVIIDLGLKRDGFVPRADLERLDEEALFPLELGQEITARIVRLEDNEGNLVLSAYKARFEQDWERAQELLESGDVWHGKVTGHNRGGLIVEFGHLNAFVPASHLAASGSRRRWSSEQRQAKLKAYLGQELPFKIIEVGRDRRRLILSERIAKQQIRDQNKEKLLNELKEGQVCRATVSGLTHYGAFVDLGGADGLIHVSELAWRRVRHPRDVLRVGDEIDVYVLRLDHERKRIGLSLKRLQPDPWDLVDQTYTLDQLVSGTVTNVVDFGAFIALDLGVEGLVHCSEMGDPPPNPRDLLQPGDELVLRIVRIDSFRQRIGLSLKRVSEPEREEWLAKQAGIQTSHPGAENESSSDGEEHQATRVEPTKEETTADKPEDGRDGRVPETGPPPFAKQTQEESYWISLIQDEEEKEKEKEI